MSLVSLFLCHFISFLVFTWNGIWASFLDSDPFGIQSPTTVHPVEMTTCYDDGSITLNGLLIYKFANNIDLLSRVRWSIGGSVVLYRVGWAMGSNRTTQYHLSTGHFRPTATFVMPCPIAATLLFHKTYTLISSC